MGDLVRCLCLSGRTSVCLSLSLLVVWTDFWSYVEVQKFGCFRVWSVRNKCCCVENGCLSACLCVCVCVWVLWRLNKNKAFIENCSSPGLRAWGKVEEKPKYASFHIYVVRDTGAHTLTHTGTYVFFFFWLANVIKSGYKKILCEYWISLQLICIFCCIFFSFCFTLFLHIRLGNVFFYAKGH